MPITFPTPKVTVIKSRLITTHSEADDIFDIKVIVVCRLALSDEDLYGLRIEIESDDIHSYLTDWFAANAPHSSDLTDDQLEDECDYRSHLIWSITQQVQEWVRDNHS